MKTWQLNLLVALSYIAAAKFCQQFAINPGNITPVWLASGISAAWVFHYGYRLLPGVGIGAAVGNFMGYVLSSSELGLFLPIMAALLNGLGDVLCVFLTCWVAKSDEFYDAVFSDVLRTLRFVFIGGALASAISAVFGVGGLTAAGMLPMEEALIALATWTIGDLMGILWIFPISTILLRGSWYRKNISVTSLLKSLLTFAIMIAVMTTALQFSESRWGFVLFSLLFPVAILGAIWIGEFWTFVGFLVVSPIVLMLDVSLTPVPTDLPFVLLQAQITLFAVVVCQLIYLGASNNTKRIYDSVSAAKDEFMAKVCHEVRTPMAGIMGNVEFLLEDGKQISKSETEDILGAVNKSCHILLGLLNNMLDFSKLDHHKAVYQEVVGNIAEICQDQVDLYRVNCYRKDLKIVFQKEENLPNQWRTDPLKLKQVLNNLVGNAVKFTQAGSIVVSMKSPRDKGGLMIEIEDTGVGMTASEQRMIFEPFWQADSSSTTQSTGTGLGLSISYRLIELMRGTLSVESLPKKGSTFQVWLDSKPAEFPEIAS